MTEKLMSEDLRAEIERLRAALAFYADREQYEDGYYDCCSEPPSIVEDGGLTARQALGIPEPERAVQAAVDRWAASVFPESKTFPCATGQHVWHRKRELAERCRQIQREKSQISPARMQRFFEVADAIS